MKKYLRVAMTLSVSLVAFKAGAWGREGHQIVAAIAQQHLTPEARTGIQQLLYKDHIYDPSVASWADDIRSSRRQTGVWHFVDIPISADVYSEPRDCEGGNCAVDKLGEFSHTLAFPQDGDNRVEALKFVVHFVGDLHQPLHSADNNDRGGNDVSVRYDGSRRPANLHKAWDSLVLDDAMGNQQPLDYAEALDSTITQSDITAWDSGDAAAWANEAHKVAQQIYSELPAAGSDGVRPLPRSYGPDHKAVLELQLKRAGIRLAKMLNDVFSQGGVNVARSGTDLVQPARATTPAQARTTASQVPFYPRNQRQKLTARQDRE
jgi:S1/P1 Nuclease